MYIYMYTPNISQLNFAQQSIHLPGKPPALLKDLKVMGSMGLPPRWAVRHSRRSPWLLAVWKPKNLRIMGRWWENTHGMLATGGVASNFNDSIDRSDLSYDYWIWFIQFIYDMMRRWDQTYGLVLSSVGKTLAKFDALSLASFYKNCRSITDQIWWAGDQCLWTASSRLLVLKPTVALAFRSDVRHNET